MSDLNTIEKFVEKKFGLEVESQTASNVSFIRVHGIDNCSLAKYIHEAFDDVSVTVKSHEAHGYSDEGWIKIEKNKDNLIHYE